MTEERTHISDEMWKKYAQGTLSTKEEEKLYTHVGVVLIVQNVLQ